MKTAALLFSVAVICLSGFAEAGPDDHAYENLIEKHQRQLQFCIEAAADEQDARDCVNQTMGDCLADKVDASRSVESGCAYRELNIWRQIHSKTVAEALNRARERDQGSLNLGSAEFGAFEKLISSEVLWLQHKTQQCELEMIKWGAGTIVSTDLPICLQLQYASRIFFLRSLRLG